jgi:hypothetical protein
MAHNLKLNIWTLKLEKQVSGKNIPKTCKEFFDESFGLNYKNEQFKAFVSEYMNSFNAHFFVDEETTKAFSYDDVGFKLEKNVIYGHIKGGITGIEQDVYNDDSLIEPNGKIKKNQVTALPYFFLLWLPVDSDLGVLMTQSYSSASINQVFIQHLAVFFKSKEFKLVKNPFISEERKKAFYDNCYVYGMSLFKRKSDLSARKKVSDAFIEEEKLKIELRFTGFKKKTIEFIRNFSGIKSNLKELGIQNEDDYDLVLYYETEDNKKAHASFQNPNLITPSIFIPNSIKEVGKDYPNRTKILEFCEKELDTIKLEQGYTPK